MPPSSTYLWTRSCRMPSDENRMTFSAGGTTAWTDDGESGSSDATTARVTATERRNRLGTATLLRISISRHPGGKKSARLTTFLSLRTPRGQLKGDVANRASCRQDLCRLDVSVYVHGPESDVASGREEERPRVPLPRSKVEPVFDARHPGVVCGFEGHHEPAPGQKRDGGGDRWSLIGEIERCRPRHLSESRLSSDGGVEVVSLGDVVGRERVVERGSLVETAVDIQSADLVQDFVEGDSPFPHCSPARDVVRIGRARVLEQRLTDLQGAPGGSREQFVVQDDPQPVHIRNARDVQTGPRRPGGKHRHGILELRPECAHRGHPPNRSSAEIVGPDQDRDVGDG